MDRHTLYVWAGEWFFHSSHPDRAAALAEADCCGYPLTCRTVRGDAECIRTGEFFPRHRPEAAL